MDETALLVDHEDTGEWPQDLLDVGALLRSGWRPLPFRQFILKVHSRCNLACDYCYVYRSADQTWRHRPVRMSRQTLLRTAERISEHIQVHALPRVQIVFHGGEPLLAGREYIDFAAAALRSAAPAGTCIDLHLQTNATLIDESLLDVLSGHGIRVGVSLDGDPRSHDAHRFHPDGRGSHADASRGLQLLGSPRYRHLFAGLLSVVDPDSDPVTTYEHLLTFSPPTVDFLLPHATWSDPPPRTPATSPDPHGDWLIAIFDRWYSAPSRETTIRLFDEIVRGVLGRPSRVESIGLSPARHIVVETDGTLERIDALKSAYEGAARTGLDITRHSFDTALPDPHLVARQIGLGALADACQKCDVLNVCGGGFYPHRYQRGSGFRNPSVYCGDLAKLIRHIHSRVRADLARPRARSGT